jgi:hypothetical protein
MHLSTCLRRVTWNSCAFVKWQLAGAPPDLSPGSQTRDAYAAGGRVHGMTPCEYPGPLQSTSASLITSHYEGSIQATLHACQCFNACRSEISPEYAATQLYESSSTRGGAPLEAEYSWSGRVPRYVDPSTARRLASRHRSCHTLPTPPHSTAS